jgi:DNA polymerase-1
MDLVKATYIDLETEGIGPRPNEYPPKIVGVGILHPNGRVEYLAFGHDSGNNCTEEEAIRAVRKAAKGPCIFHNAAFDLECIYKQWGIPFPRYWECTLIGAFLVYPHAKSLGLKKLAENLFDDPPTEKNELVEWIMQNVKGASKSTAMAYVGRAPGDLVSRYCIGDLARTRILATHLWPIIQERRMEAAYVREKRLMPKLIAAEERGIRVNTLLLSEWDERLTTDLSRIDRAVYDEIGEVNLDSGEDLADALVKSGFVPPERWLLTPSGKRATSMQGLAYSLKHHPELFRMLVFRAKCATLLRNHVLPWIEASAADGRIHSQFNQVRGEDKGGTRTGRIGSSHINLANVPQPQIIELPPGYTELPVLRRAFLPNEGDIWVSCDYSQIELRILAHLEDGELMRAYNKDKSLDVHLFVADMIRQRLGINVTRKMAKIINFATIYGAGLDGLAEQLGVSKGDAFTLKDAYMRSLPGVADMQYDIRRRGRYGEPVRTLGGRVYFAEKAHDGRDFSYKLLNYTIQGGCADLLKEAIINYTDAYTYPLLCTVYDEINVSIPEGGNMVGLQEVMCDAMKLDVPVTADLEIGENWADLQAFPT